MRKRHDHKRRPVTPSDLLAAWLLNRKDEIMDATLTAGALVAVADRRVVAAEGDTLLSFLKRHDLLTVPDITAQDAFMRRACELQEPGYVLAAAYRLGRHSGLQGRMLMAAAEEVAAADSHLDPRELEILDLLRITLRQRTGARARPSRVAHPNH